ncbi:MAG TPA: hypothetical protein VGF33_03465 [Caulobacteraceae bacterium]
MKDGFHHAVEVGVHIGIPEPEGAEAGAAEDIVAQEVVIGLNVITVLAAVDLNGEPFTEADEIEIEAFERRLAPEMEALGAEIA